jgi:phosphoribosylamine-glycine ligase
MELMVNLSDKVCCVIDFGNYISVAIRLSKDFEKVYYWAPFVINGFPEHNPKDIGRGVPEIVKISEWEPYFEEIDIFVFPDLYFSGLQSFLRRQGKLVFGSGQGQIMETDRGFMKRVQKELGLPLNDYDEVEGVYELEANLMFAEDKYIKSELRGDSETFHHHNYTTSKEELKNMKQRMGIYDKKEKYIIESSIESIAEVGIDTMSIDGQFLPESLTGIELKDVGYYGKMVPYKSLPPQLKDVTDKLSPLFQTFEYRGAYSNEVRIDKDKVGYLIDSTTRFPAPPTTLMLAMYENFSEVVWYVANGIVPIVQYKYAHGVEFIMKSESAKTQPVAIQFPMEYKRYISIKNLVVDDDGTYHFTPNGVPMKEMGSVCGLGNSMEQAVKMATEIAKTIKGFDLTINTDCIDDAKAQLKKLRENGINYL